MRSFEAFAKQLKIIFGASEDAEENAAVRLVQSLRQKGSASDYTSRFKEYMPLTGWDDEALKVMYRRGLKEQVKDEMMRSGASIDTLEDMIQEAIRIDDMLYERQMEKRHVLGRPTGYSPRGGTGGYNRDRGDPMELDATIKRGKPRKGKGKGNKKGGIKCYSCGKLGHMKKDCRTNKVQRQQINMVQTISPETINFGRGMYDTSCLEETKAKDREHACLSWTACYDDDCRVHLSDKQGSGWYPTKSRRELNVIRRKPLQQSRDGGNARHPRSPPLRREDATLQENQEPGIAEAEPGEISETQWWTNNESRTQPLIWSNESLPDSEREPPGLELAEHQGWEERIEQAQLLATQNSPGRQPESDGEETMQEEAMLDSDDESTGSDEGYTWTMEGPRQLYEMTQLIGQNFPAAFPLRNNGRLLHPIFFDVLIDKLRAMFWNHDLEEVDYDYARFVVERPPLGSRFSSDGSYVTPDNLRITRETRKVVFQAKRQYQLVREARRNAELHLLREQQLGTIPDCNTSEESENEEAPDAEAAEGSSSTQPQQHHQHHSYTQNVS
jgi:hypothetical protein